MFSENERHVEDTRRRPPDRAATRRGRPGTAGRDLNPHALAPSQRLIRFPAPPFAFAATQHSSTIAEQLRCRLAPSPPQKHDL